MISGHWRVGRGFYQHFGTVQKARENNYQDYGTALKEFGTANLLFGTDCLFIGSFCMKEVSFVPQVLLILHLFLVQKLSSHGHQSETE